MATNNDSRLYVFESELEGFISFIQEGGKYSTCTFCFVMPDDVMEKALLDRTELLQEAAEKLPPNTDREVNSPRWNEEGFVKYSWGGTTSRQAPVVIDEYGDPVATHIQDAIRSGTIAKLIVEQKAYWKPCLGTSLTVHGVQIKKLVTSNEVSNPGLEIDEVRELCGVNQNTFRSKVSKALAL